MRVLMKQAEGRWQVLLLQQPSSFPLALQNSQINDSKKLTARKRDELYKTIWEDAVAVGVGVAEADVIDRINILQASLQAMREAVLDLSRFDFIFVDGLYP